MVLGVSGRRQLVTPWNPTRIPVLPPETPDQTGKPKPGIQLGQVTPALDHAIMKSEDSPMWLEFRELEGVRMTFVSGKKEPVWLVADLVRKLGHVPRAARRLRWNRRLVRAAYDHAEWNAVAMQKEREAALAAGFRSEVLQDSPHGLVFPASALAGKPVRRRRFCRCRRF